VSNFYIVTSDPLEENRPQIYTAGTDDRPLFILNADNPRWRMPPCELRDMAREIEAENGGAKQQSQADRMKIIEARMMDHFEQMGLVARGAFVNRPLRSR
jgi:hypothetical protein